MEKIKSYIPEWQKLRIIGNSKIVSMTILVPFIGYLILFNNELFAYFSLSKELLHYPETKSSITDDTISRLYYLYYGLTILGVSSILFSLICPPIVKNHKDEYEYLDNEIKMKTRQRITLISKQLENTIESESNERNELQGYLWSFNNAWRNAESSCGGEGYSVISKRCDELEMEAYINIIRFNWVHHTKSKIYTRFVMTTGYIAGFLLVLYPSLQVFNEVSLIILSR